MKNITKIQALAGMLLIVVLNASSQTIIYVDDSAPGLQNGTSWINAFTDLQDALSSASSNSEIWVAEGIYFPGDTVTATFELKNQVALYGGFDGSETNRSERDWSLNETLLSGDIGRDDVYGGVVWYSGWNINSYNSHHVVSSVGVGSSAIIDGFTIAGGDILRGVSWSANFEDYGGGLYNVNGSPTITNCTFTKNFCITYASGAGIYSNGGSPHISHCIFLQNYAYQSRGAGMSYTGTGSPLVEHCQFIANVGFTGASLASRGAGIYVEGPSPMTIRDCLFQGNIMNSFPVGLSGSRGAGIYSGADGQVVERCLFKDNRANYGSGVCLNGNNNLIVNSLFDSNVATSLSSPSGTGDNGDYAGGIYAWPGSAGDKITKIVNCTFVDNNAGEAAAMDGGNFILENSIVWGNTATGFDIEPLKTQVSGVQDYFYSDVQYLFDTVPGEDPPDPADFPGCLDTDPNFAGTGDYHLSSSSPCIDAADADRLPAGTSTDLDGFARAFDDPATANTGVGAGPAVDMGCYEFNQPCGSTVSPVGLMATPVSSTKVNLSWTALNDAEGYQVSGGLVGGPTGSFITPLTSKSVNGLTPGANYEWKLRARCLSSGAITQYSITNSFTMPLVRESDWVHTTIYPVPASDFVRIEGIDPGSILDVRSLSGQVVFYGAISNQTLDITKWATGIYILESAEKQLRGIIVKNK